MGFFFFVYLCWYILIHKFSFADMGRTRDAHTIRGERSNQVQGESS